MGMPEDFYSIDLMDAYEELGSITGETIQALEDAFRSMKKVMESIENGLPEDFYTIDLMDAYRSLGEITGETAGEDLINEIFSKFCMGK